MRQFGALWSGLALPLTDAPWHLSTAQIGLFGLAGLVGAARAGRWAGASFANAVTGDHSVSTESVRDDAIAVITDPA
ncbi:hypothetical protein AB0L06_43475 [Spirillospora sp. NPDC052269]